MYLLSDFAKIFEPQIEVLRGGSVTESVFYCQSIGFCRQGPCHWHFQGGDSTGVGHQLSVLSAVKSTLSSSHAIPHGMCYSIMKSMSWATNSGTMPHELEAQLPMEVRKLSSIVCIQYRIANGIHLLHNSKIVLWLVLPMVVW